MICTVPESAIMGTSNYDLWCRACLFDHRNCPADFGEWGAWRACADMLTAIYTGLEESGAMGTPILFFSWGGSETNYDLFRYIAIEELDAVGWSP